MSNAARARPKFTWPTYPGNATEFEALMRAVDGHLQAMGVLPWQRPLHMGLLLHDALGWEGNAYPPRELAHRVGFTGQVLMAKAHRWYEEVYGDKLNSDWGPGHVPVRIANAIWRVRMPLIFGQCGFFIDRNLENRGTSGIEQQGLAK